MGWVAVRVDLSGLPRTVTSMSITALPAPAAAFEQITADEAVAALTQGAFTITADESTRKAGDRIVHARGKFTGADWDLAEAIEFVREAEQVGWSPDRFMRHDLLAVGPNGQYRFDIRKPQPIN